MYQKKHRRAARWRHFLALTFTVVFHVGLISFIASDGDLDALQQYVPEFVQDWFGMEPSSVAADSKDAPRP
ncbi:MAG: hypothetical protein AAF798_06515 [Bacteroidota bacterium]